MGRKKKTKSILIFSFYVILLIGLVYGLSGTYNLVSYSIGGQQQFAVNYGELVYEPTFASIRCIETDKTVPNLFVYPYGKQDNVVVDYEMNNVLTTRKTTNAYSGFDLYCSRMEDRVFTDECDITAKVQTDKQLLSSITMDVYICDANQNNLAQCNKQVLQLVPDNVANSDQWKIIDTITRDQVLRIRNIEAELFGFDRTIDKGEIIFRSQRDEFGLLVDANGFKEVTNSCDLQHLIDSNTDILESEYNQALDDGRRIGTRLDFGATINYVYGFTAISNSKRIIDNGEYYTYGGGIKYPIVKGKSGRNYVDLKQKIEASNIICDPAQIYCINEGTALDPQWGLDEDCDDGDIIVGWLPYSEKEGWVAQRECVAGTWIETNAKPVPECGGDTPVLNENFECVAGSTDGIPADPPQSEEPDYFPVFVLGAVVAIAGIMRIRNRMQNKGGQ